MKSLIREDSKREFSITHARELVRDLYRPNPWIYWSDFLGSALLGWGAFARTLMAPIFSLQQGFCFLIAVLAIYRAALHGNIIFEGPSDFVSAFIPHLH